MKFGIGISQGRNVTSNESRIGKVYYNFYSIEAFNERNYTSNNFFISLFTETPKAGGLKMQFGRHTNGLMADLSNRTDASATLNIDRILEYTFLQIGVNYIYNIDIGRSRIPLEIGYIHNTNFSEVDNYISINKYNKDIRFSLGYSYKITSSFHLGLNFVYTRALNNYLNTMYKGGEYLPLQRGPDLSLKYYFE